MELSRVLLDVRTVADGRVGVRLAGELDLAEADAVRRILMAEAQASAVVAVDLAGLSFIDLSGVRALNAAQRAASECGSRLVLVSPPRCLTMLVRLMDLGAMRFTENRSLLEESRGAAGGSESPGRRLPTRRARADGARAWRASSRRPPGPVDPSCPRDDPS